MAAGRRRRDGRALRPRPLARGPVPGADRRESGMSRQLRSELLKQRTTRTTLILLAWMLGLILLVVLLHALALKASDLAKADNQPKVYGWVTSIGALFA